MSIRNQILIAFVLIFFGCLLVNVSRAADAVPQIPADATSEQVDAILAGMSDEQVRALLLEELRKEALAPAATQEKNLAQVFSAKLARVHERFDYLFGDAAQAAEDIPDVVFKAVSGRGKVPLIDLAKGIVLLSLIWIGVRMFYRRKTRNLRNIIETTPKEWGFFRKVLRLCMRASIDLFGIVLSSVVILGVYLFLYEQSSEAKPIILSWFITVLLVDFVGLVARFVLVPKAEGLRYLPLSNETAMTVYQWVLWISRIAALGLLISFLILLQGEAERWYLLSLAVTSFIVVCGISLLVVWEARNGTAALRKNTQIGSLRYQVAGIWHVMLVTLLFFGWLCWLVVLMVRGSGAVIPAVATILSVPVYCIVNWLAQQLVDCMSGVALKTGGCQPIETSEGQFEEAKVESEQETTTVNTEAVEHTQDSSDQVVQSLPATTALRFCNFLKVSFRVGIFLLIFMGLLNIWGVPVRVGLDTAGSFIGILFTIVVAYILWALISVAIERKIDAYHAKDNESGGSAGGDRFATLLQLFRKFLFGFLVVVVSLIILSSLGIDITPLLAGASVFGLAIGFGAQTLVKDIISGIFFLMDDAFRVNDYIQVGNSMGTVEEISIRALKLRHHRGSLFTIPFGTINFVTNMSRGFAIMKLEYLVPFDTDVNKIKKIIKRINKEVREDPDLDALLLDDIKSQGVKAIEQYGLRMRVKFMTKPGGQWSIRKIVYTKMRQIFKEEGIEFARPTVAVHVPKGEQLTPEQQQELSAAAQNMADDDAAAQAKGTK
ncbi:mechanosensitive ion channel family protein [Halodesulfovibrio marinisediminis]|uniref:Small-conductance mechanosensitive channel n=1 Tax=Halodesulfovibrio marinisediminis DSM 17456 TaxID=1121457 RepID=A0A1N6IBZ6_9BACT|nr:mechanosensitive ion channel family protein [Halodesulfovibrio marinisediminis]SIO29543.1 Small-conductance mechanosensitive channel [Halodesulfovibrio marinisediminis DSM 17456]